MRVLFVRFFFLKEISCEGIILMAVAHGLCSSGLFFLVKKFYENRGSRNILLRSNVLKIFSVNIFFWGTLCFINASIPPSLNFLSELFLFFSIIRKNYLNFLFVVFIVFFNGLFKVFLYV